MNAKYRSMLAVLGGLALLAVPLSVQAQDVIVTLTIVRVRQIDNVDDTRPGEFYAQVRMGRRVFPKTGHREDDGDVSPNWTFRYAVAPGSEVPLRIQILDHDDPDPDDLCNLSPVANKKTLEIYYDLRTGQISGDITGGEGDLIHVRGAGNSDRVHMWFRLTQSRVPPPPAQTASPENLPGSSCGSCTLSRVDGNYERSTSVDVACPRIEAVEPDETYPEQWISIRGNSFGDSVDRIGPCHRGEKRVMMIRLKENGSAAMPIPIRLRISDWSNDQIFAQLPANISPGRYRLGIFYPLIPGSRLSSGLVSNMLTVNVGR